jgi:hypothetical protein
MGRLFAFFLPFLLAGIAMSLTASPAMAEVCDKVQGEGSSTWLMNAPLWRSLLHQLLSPYVLIGWGIAALTIADPGFGRWFAILAGLAVGTLAVISIQENLFPHQLVAMARAERCGEAYLAGAILSSVLTLVLLGAFAWSFRQKPAQHH